MGAIPIRDLRGTGSASHSRSKPDSPLASTCLTLAWFFLQPPCCDPMPSQPGDPLLLSAGSKAAAGAAARRRHPLVVGGLVQREFVSQAEEHASSTRARNAVRGRAFGPGQLGLPHTPQFGMLPIHWCHAEKSG